jgi:NO-binding membrane sensor protein with MHYT domain
MHYTAMGAVTFMPANTPPDLTYALDISTLAHAAIIILTFVLLGSVVLLRWWAAPSARNIAISRA